MNKKSVKKEACLEELEPSCSKRLCHIGNSLTSDEEDMSFDDENDNIYSGDEFINNFFQKANLNYTQLKEMINLFASIKQNPNNYIFEYFENIKHQIEIDRDRNKNTLDNYYDQLIIKIKRLEEQCHMRNKSQDLDNQFTQNGFWFDNLKQRAQEGQVYLGYKDSIDHSKFEILNNQISNDLKNLTNNLNKLKLYLLDYKSYRYDSKSLSGYELGVIKIQDKIKDEFKLICYDNNNIKLCSMDNQLTYKSFRNYFTRSVAALSVNQFISCTFDDKSIRLWDIHRSESPVKSFSLSQSVPVILLRKSDNEFISGCEMGKIYMWDINRSDFIKCFNGHRRLVTGLEIISNNRLVSCSTDLTIKIWNLSSGENMATLIGHTDSVDCIKMMNDSMMISGSSDKTIKIWDFNKHECVKTISGHIGGVCTLELLPNNRLASGSKYEKIRIWDLEKETCVATLYSKNDVCTNTIKYIKYLGNERLMSYSKDRSIRIWDLVTYECIEMFDDFPTVMDVIKNKSF